MPSLFALGIQQSITLQLHGEGMPMPKFILSIQIARRSFIGDLKKLKLTALSLAVMLVTGAQTAGFVHCSFSVYPHIHGLRWSNLITPQFLDFESSITGRELDLSSTLLQSSLPDPVHKKCVFDNSKDASLILTSSPTTASFRQ